MKQYKEISDKSRMDIYLKKWLCKKIIFPEKLFKEVIYKKDFINSWSNDELEKSIECDRFIFRNIRQCIVKVKFEEKLKNMHYLLNAYNDFSEEKVRLIEDAAKEFLATSEKIIDWIEERTEPLTAFFSFCHPVGIDEMRHLILILNLYTNRYLFKKRDIEKLKEIVDAQIDNYSAYLRLEKAFHDPADIDTEKIHTDIEQHLQIKLAYSRLLIAINRELI